MIRSLKFIKPRKKLEVQSSVADPDLYPERVRIHLSSWICVLGIRILIQVLKLPSNFEQKYEKTT
jgi:hypothetical protein